MKKAAFITAGIIEAKAPGTHYVTPQSIFKKVGSKLDSKFSFPICAVVKEKIGGKARINP